MAALARAEALTVAGDSAAARRWLERAMRLAPADPTLRAMLAAALIGHDDARACALFADLAAEADRREIWLGLAATQARCGRIAAAATALAHLLSHHMANEAVLGLGFALSPRLSSPGFCALAREAGGRPALVLAPSNPRAAIVAMLDGRRLVLPPLGESPPRLPLPANWRTGRWLAVTADGVTLCGSPIDLAAICRIEGHVGSDGAGGLSGWAWHPGDPDGVPSLRLRDRAGAVRLLHPRGTALSVPGSVLARPRGFALDRAALAGLVAPFALTDAAGAALSGSPVTPRPPRPLRRAGAPPRRIPRPRPVSIVLPVHGAAADTLACLAGLLATMPAGAEVVVIDDASPDAALAAALVALAATGAIRLIRNPQPRGFPASVNQGLAQARGRDVLVLNSDTLLPPQAIARLAAAAYADAAIGSATPFSNNATIFSYPAIDAANAMPDAAGTARLAAQAWQANGAAVVDVPVGVGFCLFLRHDCLAATGRLRSGLFAQGYGEETDFCLRAAASGWRHVAATGVFVAHRGGASFAAPARQALQTRNAAIVAALHPGYAAQLDAFGAADPLAAARRAFDLIRWRTERAGQRGGMVLLSHAEGGGVAAVVGTACARAEAAGRRAVLLQPAPDGGVALRLGMGHAYPNLRFAIPKEWPVLRRLLLAEGAGEIAIHHALGHHPALITRLTALGVPYRVHIHDYALFCPRIALVDASEAYCGEPPVAGCIACIGAAGRLDGETIAVPALRARSAALLGGAAGVIAPSADAAARLRRHFPATPIRIAPPERDSRPDPGVFAAAQARAVAGRVCVIGAIGLHKGYHVLSACARDAATRGLNLEFIVVGHTIDDAALLDTGRVFITGRYAPGEAVELIAAQRAALGFLPSIWPETWNFTLSEAWRAGLGVAAFDLGAPADRIRRHGGGFLLAPGLDAASINSALMAAMAAQPLVPGALSGDE